MRVVTVRTNAADYVEAGLVGQRSEQFRQVTLTSADISNLTIADGLREPDGLGTLSPTAASGSILLTPNERRVAEDRRDCYWLYVVTNCASTPELQEPIKDPARFPWHEVTKVAHYYLSVDTLKQPLEIRRADHEKVNTQSRQAQTRWH